MTSIKLHSRFGVNPTMATCYICNEPSEIILVGSSTKPFRDAGIAVSKDGEMPMNVGVMDGRPCSKCEGYMKQGVILISVRDDQENEIQKANTDKRLPNPFRTGGWVVIKDDAIRRMLNPPELVESVLRKRMCFVPDQAWDALGLPKGKIKSKEEREDGKRNDIE